MGKQYDLIVLGTGTAGSTVAEKCKAAGWTVAIIDDRPFGGTCSQRGCDPKKVLVSAGELIDWNERMDGLGIDGEPTINCSDLMALKRTFTASIPDDTEEKYKELGIDSFHGRAYFESEKDIRVGENRLTGKHILIATGARPMEMGMEGEAYLATSDEFMELEDLPKRIVFVGGGFISFEFAHLAARAGAEVHILHRSKNPLKQFDQDLVKFLLKRSEEIGIQVHLDVDVKSIQKNGETFTVTGEKNSVEQQWKTDYVVHGAGRAPSLDINLEAGNVERDKKGVSVNEYMQSISNPHVYAAGDVASTKGPPLTPVASAESYVVAQNLIHGNTQKIDHPIVPSVVFTVPKLASVGMSEQEAKESGLDIEVKFEEVTDWFTYRHTNEAYAAYKVIIDKKNNLIIGAHFLSGEADELVNNFAIAIRFKLPISELKQMNFAYPTVASDMAYMI